MNTPTQSVLVVLLTSASLPLSIAPTFAQEFTTSNFRQVADAAQITFLPNRALDEIPVSYPLGVSDTAGFSLAQTESESTDVSPDLRVRARVGAGYSTASGGYPALGRFEAFVPLLQTIGEDLGFLEGKLLLNTDDTTAGGLLVGYRGYNDDADRIRGGYLGFDARGTEGNTFYQLSTGYESLGRDWDFRFNAYLPVGDRDNTLSDISTDTGVQTSTRFQGNLLLLERQRQRQRLFEQENALGGFDAEAGTRLTSWETGELKGFGGLYLYGAPNLDTYIGWRLRLAADITPNFNTGLALQGDGLFGTRLVFSVGATFPGVRPAGPIPEADEIRARLGEPTVRMPEIAVHVTTESEIVNEQDSQPLQNPEEDQNYRFQHVVLGRSGGDGTAEAPFGTVQEALNATAGDGNDVVYVRSTTDELIPSLTIPDRVQLLSAGPRQLLAGLPISNFAITPARLPFSSQINFDQGIVVELPFSGNGNFPSIDGVTLGNRTVLAGFRIENAIGNAIAANNVRNVELRNNTLTNPTERGIFLDDVGGSAILFDNRVSGAQGNAPDSGQGIFIRNTTTLNSVEVAISGFQADSNRVGIELAALGSLAPPEAPNQTVIIGPSSTLNTSIGLSSGTAISNSASNNRDAGIRVTATNLGGQEVNIQNVAVTNNGSDGLNIIGGIPAGILTSFQELQLRNSTISNNAGAGINIEANESTTQEFNFDNNQIINNAGAGIVSVANDSALQEFVAKTEINSQGIGNNIITGNGGIGINLSTSNAETLLVEAFSNQLNNNASGGNDIQVSAENTTRVCFIAFGNTISPTITLNNTTAGQFQVSDLPNLSANNDAAVVNLNITAPATSFTNIDRQACL